MAEALCKIHENGFFIPMSAGIKIDNQINPKAVRTIKELYHHDMRINQKPKSVAKLKDVDVLIIVDDETPSLDIPHQHFERWDVDDPYGMDSDAFIRTANKLLSLIELLKKKIISGEVTVR